MKTNAVPSRIRAAYIFIIFLVLDLLIGSRGYLIAYSAIAIYVTARLLTSLAKSTKATPISTAVVLLAPTIGTIYAKYGLGLEFSIYQVARSQAWTILGVLVALALQRKLSSIRHSTVLATLRLSSTFLTLAAIAGLLDFTFGTHIAPSQIRIIGQNEGTNRLYIVGIEFATAFLPVFAWQKMYVAMIACVAIILMTGGKMAIAVLAIATIFTILTTKGRFLTKSMIFIGFATTLLIYVNQIGSRIDTFVSDGDARRFQQINDSYQLFTADYVTIAIGGGLGTAYSEGYNIYSNDASIETEQRALLENSRFDIENGYMFLVTRLGILGSLAFIYLLGRSTDVYRFYFLLYCLISWLGGSPVGPSFFISAVCFSFAAACAKNRSKSIDHTKSWTPIKS